MFTGKRKKPQGLRFQDREMKTTFSAYPELLFLDAKYKLLELGLPVYLMLSADANGQNKVITVCLYVQEDADSVTWMVDAFKKNNKDWHKICIIMADKDIGEREVMKQCIPSASVLICFFRIPCKPFVERYHVKNGNFIWPKDNMLRVSSKSLLCVFRN